MARGARSLGNLKHTKVVLSYRTIEDIEEAAPQDDYIILLEASSAVPAEI